MNLSVHSAIDQANAAAADLLAKWLIEPGVRNLMLAAGNTPLDLYNRIAKRKLRLAHLSVFALDEYLGVPPGEPRNCANLIKRTAADPWGVPSSQYYTLSPIEAEALPAVQEHERRISAAGGLDVIVLGLGQNGHLGFNEPGSAEDSSARLLDLAPISVEANRRWFSGEYAPSRGVTVGMRTILSAHRVLIMAYGPHKAGAVKAMVQGPRSVQCPASLLQEHANVHLFLDAAAAAHVEPQPRASALG